MNDAKKLRTIQRITFVIWLISTVIFVLSVTDLKIEHFEDGSGRITYCLPFEDAGPYLGGCK